jgi:RES domain-containing protein
LPPEPRALPHAIEAFRIGDPNGRYPIFSGEGAARTEARWHAKGQAVIYASRSYSTALLEKLAHHNGVLPTRQHFIRIEIPAGLTYEVVTKDSLPSLTDAARARAFGSTWYDERRSAVLVVPSIVARMEQNVILNCRHPEFFKIKPGLEEPVVWDERLFK